MSEEPDFIIMPRDLISKGMCFNGQRTWFALHGLDFRDYVKNGMLASKFIATGDALGIKAAKIAKVPRV